MTESQKPTLAQRSGRPLSAASKTLSETAYDMLKELLISAQYVPGQFLQESQVAEDLGLGRTPVNQALHRLQQEGLVEIIARKGILVRSDSLSEIHLALEARALVEPFCAQLCAERRTEAEFAELAAICARFDSGHETLDKKTLMEWDRLFHNKIGQFSGNHLVGDFQSAIHDRMSRIWFLPTWHFHDFNMTGSEHGAILEAIRIRDGQAAATAMRAHVDSLRQRIISASPH
ncbi:GntR family transcriptional regulator [Gemmobacter fulvus]|nr:GntR family transcriptional regulator [Gemmobacter fulvus]MBT9246227.1 GntR family transcriptional regulator [Gemmobacter fulvus]MDQ1850190.1 GntR family transcriptional regulator [Gemmobacter fulvus]